MRAIILVGGFGTRLRPLTFTIPKQMLPVVEVPMLERKIADLVANGIEDIVLSMGYRPDAFQAAYPDNTCAGARLTYVIESEPLGTAGAIAFAAREAGVDDTFLAMNGDTLTDIDIKGVIDFHRSHGAEGTITLTPVEDPSRFGVVPTDDDGRVRAFIEKPAREDAPTNLINAGTYVLEPSFLDRVEPGREISIEREIFPAIVADGGLYAGHFDKYWLDIGTPEAYLQGNLDVLERDHGGDTVMGANVKVADSTTVKRSVIGAGTVIGANVNITDSVILPGVVVEDGVTLDRSIVGEQARIGTNATLTNLTVVGGAQRVTAGVTLDNQKVNPPQS